MTPTPEQIQLLQKALAMCSITVCPQIADTILRIIPELNEKGGDFTLADAVRIEADVLTRYAAEPTIIHEMD